MDVDKDYYGNVVEAVSPLAFKEVVRGGNGMWKEKGRSGMTIIASPGLQGLPSCSLRSIPGPVHVPVPCTP